MNRWVVMVAAFVVVLAAATYFQRGLFDRPDPNLALKRYSSTNSQNYRVIDGKVVPMTRLSEEDAKRPCEDCHQR